MARRSTSKYSTKLTVNLKVAKFWLDNTNLKNKSVDYIQSIYDEGKSWHSNIEIELEMMDIESLKDFRGLIFNSKKTHDVSLEGGWTLAKLIDDHIILISNDSPEGPIMSQLKLLPKAFNSYIKKVCPNQRLYRYDENIKVSLPYVFLGASYNSATDCAPAYVELNLKYVEANKVEGININCHYEDLSKNSKTKSGPTLKELLQNKGYFLETPELNIQYSKTLVKFNELKNKVGLQLLGEGYAVMNSGRWYRNDKCFLSKDGVKSKLVIDILDEKDGKEEKWTTFTAQSLTLADTEEGGEEDVYKSLVIPVHPLLRAFDLKNHRHVWVHVNNIEVYIYDKELDKKLVLPSDHKKLIGILMNSSAIHMEDIIKGKSGGIIVAATGSPGTGKTLTAEVYSEVVEKPLYIVQSSQLGMNIDDLEKKLVEILTRAQRWGAILLIDEADVYIRERGGDLLQNAVVGVFLRVLEYFNGILFLTSNRGDIIDDAIMSRVTAHIDYHNPDIDGAKKIWNILSEQFGLEVDFDMDNLYGNGLILSGRDIKSLLKLIKLLKTDSNKVTLEDVKFVIPYLK